MVMPHITSIVLAVLVLDGCVSLSKSYPEKHYYALEAVRQGETVVSLPGTVLRIRKLRAAPAFEGKELVYRTSDGRYEEDFYNEWFVRPNVMLTQQVRNWLTATGLFQSVTDSSGPLPATHTLEGTVLALYGDYRATPAKAVLGLQFFLLLETSGEPDIILQREYRKEIELSEKSPDGLVNGCNSALELILTALDEDLNRTLQRTPPRR